jgi:hypothetical protein
LTVTTAPSSTFNAAITLAISGLPTGMTVQMLPASVVPAPGGRTTTVTFSVASKAAAKAYVVSVSATGGGVTQTQKLTVAVGAQTASHAQFPQGSGSH